MDSDKAKEECLEPEVASKKVKVDDTVLPVKSAGEEATKLLQAMALWAEGAGDPNAESDTALGGWSTRYAANFDRQDEPVLLDLAPILGLPQGTPTEEVVRIADEQEENLIAQLIS